MLLVVTAAAPASAAPPHDFAAVHVMPPLDPRVSIERSAVQVKDVGKFQIVTVMLSATSSALVAHDTDLTLRIPRAARVVGLALEQDGRMAMAESLEPIAAREDFIESLPVDDNWRDPAMIELVAHDQAYDRLGLSLFPVSAGQRATTKFTILVPRAERLVVDVAGRRHEHRAAAAAEPTRDDRDIFESIPVTDRRSLFVGAPLDPAQADVRTFMMSRREALRACNSGRNRVRVVVDFTIGVDGTAHVDGVRGAEHDDLRLDPAHGDTVDPTSCMRNIVEGAQLRGRATPTAIHYPLVFNPY
jgi:hypothetical protein